MLHQRTRVLTLVVAIAAMALTPVGASATDEKDVERAESERQVAYQRLIEVNSELDAALLDYHTINGELVELEQRMEIIVERIGDHEEQVTMLQERARQLVTEAYMSAGTDLFHTAFEAESLQDLLTSQVIIDRAADQDLIALDRLDAVTREMDRLRQELKKDQERTEELSVAAGEVVERLDELQQERAEEYARSDEAARQARVRYEEEQRRRRIAEAAAKKGASGGVGVITGFACPVPGASFINDWGFPRSGGRRHQGTDVFAARGTPTVAVGNGTVSLKSSSLGGITLYLRTSQAMYYYAHLDSYAAGISNGTAVKTGQVVGYVGNTGNAIGTSPHLHFQIHPGGGGPVNPYPTLRASC